MQNTTPNPFFANAVHELRTPIQTIIGTLELLGDTKLDQEQKEYVRQVKFSSDVLLSLANDLLDISKMQSGQFHIETIPISPISSVEGAADLICIEAHNKGLELVTDVDYELPPLVMGDPTRLQQILLNLVKNAVKFTSSGYIVVKLSKHKEHNTLLFEIIDSGIGVPEEKKHLIFQEFQQADVSTTRKYGGTGLGLSICKTLVQLMGGTIGIKDNLKGGSIFWFEIPIIISENCIQPKQKEISKPIPDNVKILIVDDNEVAFNSMKSTLKSLGVKNIDTASTGEEALAKMHKAAQEDFPYTIAYIDMIMPVMDGWRLSAEINADKAINSTKLYLLVPEGQMRSEAKMKMLDWFNGYLYKPIKRNILSSMLLKDCEESIDLEIAESDSSNSFDLPVQNGIPPKVNLVSEIQKPTKICKILVAEDHPVNLNLLKTFLEQLNAEVITATNGQEVIDQIDANMSTDIVFMDIQMPIKNGVQATVEIRKLGYNGIIIACTANSDEADFEVYYKNGMNDVLVKPFKKQSVISILDKWMTVISFDNTKQQEIESNVQNQDNTKNPKKVIWDVEDMLSTLSNDKTLAIELIEQFITQTKSFILAAKQAVLEQNYSSLSRIAHSIKGSSGTLSVIELSKISKQLEDAAHNENIELLRIYVNDFIVAFNNFQKLANQTLIKWKQQ